jgi:FkbM family methyltransferase
MTYRRRDCRSPFRLRVPSSDVPTYKQVFVNREYDFSVPRPPRTIVDAGANIGLASIYFANKFPDARIIAVEPEASNFALLVANVAPYPNIVPVQAALWNTNEKVDVFDPGNGHWAFTTADRDCCEPHRGAVTHSVKALTVDCILEDFGLERIDILKVDIEGAEREVFAESASWIGKVDVLIVELHERLKPGCNRSFYNGSNGFDREWQQGENVFLARAGCAAGATRATRSKRSLRNRLWLGTMTGAASTGMKPAERRRL